MKPWTAILIGCAATVYLALAVMATYGMYLIRDVVPLAVLGLFCHVLTLGLLPVLFWWAVRDLRQLIRRDAEQLVAAVELALKSQTWELTGFLDDGFSGRLTKKVVAGTQAADLAVAHAHERKTAGIAAALAAETEGAAGTLKQETADIAATLASADRTNREGTAGLVRDDAAVVAEAHREQTADIAQRLADAMDRERTDPVSDDEG